MYEKTLILLKPDAIERQLIGSIITYFEEAGLKIHGLKLIKAKQSQVETHYQEHKEKPFFPSVVEFLTSGPIVALVVGGYEAIAKVRKICGDTEPGKAEVASIRGRWAHISRHSMTGGILKNLVHSSDCRESAAGEIAIWFDESELLDYSSPNDGWFNF